jgi:hypothetical protein
MLIEQSAQRAVLTLQPVILEYVTEQLLETLYQEIGSDRPDLVSGLSIFE